MVAIKRSSNLEEFARERRRTLIAGDDAWFDGADQRDDQGQRAGVAVTDAEDDSLGASACPLQLRLDPGLRLRQLETARERDLAREQLACLPQVFFSV
jgi:hypothetical protein